MSEEERLWILTKDGPNAAEVGTDQERSTLGAYWNEVQRFLHSGEDSGLRQFRGVRIGEQTLLTNPDAIETWARVGELDFEDIYESGGPGR